MRSICPAVMVFLVMVPMVVAADYFPLKEGNQWSYTMSNGMQMTVKVAGFAEVNGIRCAIVESDMGMQTSREYMALDSDGLKSYKAESMGQEIVYDKPVMRIKLPFQPGQSWTSSINQFGMTITTTFESVGTEQVQIPAGNFDCIVIRSTMSMPGQAPMVSESYYADGKGLVRQKIQASGQEMTVTLTNANVQPAPQTPPAPRPAAPVAPTSPTTIHCPKCNAVVDANAKFCPQCGAPIPRPAPAAPTVCPKCGAKLPVGAKFCPSCGEKITSAVLATNVDQSTAQTAVGQSDLEKYQSPDGKVMLYKPKDWNVTQGDMFGQGTYGVVVMEPKEDAVVIFLTFAVSEQIKDSVVLAAKCIEALKEEYPDLQATNMNSTAERERTIADITLTDEGEKGTGHAYFFRTQNLGSVYILLAKEQNWKELRPVLTAIAANLAFAPQGIAAVQEQGQKLAAQAQAAEAPVSTLAAMIKDASQKPGKQVALQRAALPDQSLSIQMPQGWTIEGQKLQFTIVDDPRTRMHGMGYVTHTIIPMDIQMQGVINTPYQPPPQALNLVLQVGHTGRDLQIINEYPAEQAVPSTATLIQSQRAQGYQVDARLIHARFRNILTGAICRGLFNVMCSIRPMMPVWQVSVQGSWAPDNEFDDWLPLYMQLEKTIQVNERWFQGEMANRAVVQQQLNRNLQNSIAGANQAFDGYLDSLQNASHSRDYTAHMWSETTLGQGTWVAENEGARVYQTDSWGIQGPEGRIDNPAYNTTNFTGENPWGGQLELVDTRAEYEKYIANR
jgi:RNA polymerase subunit RPABC4/transcription elongation factor Spt4